MYQAKRPQLESQSEVDESMSFQPSIVDEDKQFLVEKENENPLGHLRKKRMSWKKCLLFFNLILLIGGLTVWAHVIVLLRSLRCDTTPQTDHFEPDLLFKSRITFQPHSFYGGPPTNATNEMWQRLSPPGDGIVEVPNAFTANLPPSLPAENNPEDATTYGVSMFHQLHCLNFLRFAYYPEQITDMSTEEVTFHRDHCLDYIRQAIMCAGDATFEPLTKVGINGMGATHMCRDFENLFSWAYEHRSDKKHGSGYNGGKITHTPGHRNDFAHEE